MTTKSNKFGLKPGNYLIINCIGFKAVATQIAALKGFSPILDFYSYFLEWTQE